jgi:predicted phosphate transport protein (TIGR00153 family)
MGLQDVIRFLIPKEDKFFDFLEQQAALAHEGAVALATIGETPIAELKELVHAIEKRGDKVAHECEDALAKTFVTPLDREDIHALSSQLDDVLDRAHAAASAFVMFSIDEPSKAAREMIDLLVKSTALLKDVLPSLRKHDFDRIREVTREIKVLEKEGDRVYRGTMMALFRDPEQAKESPYHNPSIKDARSLIREKELVEILEEALDGCEDVGEFLTMLAVKHG